MTNAAHGIVCILKRLLEEFRGQEMLFSSLNKQTTHATILRIHSMLMRL
jgi:hypothetical protein